MKYRGIVILAALAPLLFAVPQAAQGASKPVMVHYMPWFVSKPYSGSWGWHWTMNHFNPDLVNTNGQRQIASWYYPLIGPYDSVDPAVLEYHALLMKLAGIDGVIVDWYGSDNYNDYAINNQRTLALLNYTRKAGLKFSLCYEDATIQQEISGSYITAGAAISHAQQTMLYVQTNYFTDPSFLRLSNAPVFLNFGPQYFKNNSDWVSIFSVLNPTNQPAFFTEDNRLAAGWGAFDWPPMWMSGGGTNTLTQAQLQSYLTSFDQKGGGWPAFVSSAFPRFHDIYAQAGVGASYGYLDDANGSTLTNTLSWAMTNNSAIVQLVTWNDFGEGTIIEPTQDYGYRDLGIVQNLRRQYLDPGFSYHTNDLAMALRFYNLRKQYANSTPISAELNRIFTNIVSGQISMANLRLTGIESNRPVIYNLSHSGIVLQFQIGGYVASSVQVQVSTNLTSWQTAQTFAVTTNVLVFSTDVTQTAYSFFKAQ
ncbi:MAG TPA: glycoside hydrolase family 71/99-like protein [Candidatus Binatia bacterium]|nr:glycoside hydrolase family 71/99-like protein [Candidatus Binatia bacterium]